MLKILFGKCPQVKTLDFLLSASEGNFNKTQLANGSEISRPTLDNFIEDFIKYGLVNKNEDNYFMLNRDSEIVKSFARANILLAKTEAEIQSELHIPQKVEYTEEELDELVDDLFDEEELTEEEYQEKIAEEEEILVNKKEYEQLLNHYHTNIRKSNESLNIIEGSLKRAIDRYYLGESGFQTSIITKNTTPETNIFSITKSGVI